VSIIDLTLLSPPDVIELLNFDTIFNEMLADLKVRDPAFTALVESDPAYKIIEVCAYRELLMRARVNDAAKAVMLAYAAGTDLDHLAAAFGVSRLLVSAGDPEAVPPIDPVYESDTALRYRVQLATESWTCAGSSGAYEFHALSASADVADVAVESPAAGQVLVTILSATGNGVASAQLINTITSALSAETVRPLTDQLTVQAAEIVTYEIDAELTLYTGPDSEVVRSRSEAAAIAYAEAQHKLGRDITLSGIYAALHQPGVQNVQLTSPAGDIVIGSGQASYCESVTVTVGGYDE
jgi:phage-related baseplate assembly protein